MPLETIKIGELPIGSRILYRSKENWRTAAISKFDDEFAILTVCSPKGRTYRLKRKRSAEISLEGSFAILIPEYGVSENWTENFGEYDQRW